MTLKTALQPFTKEIRLYEANQELPASHIRKKINEVMVDYGEQSQDISCGRCMGRMFSRAVGIINTPTPTKKPTKKKTAKK